MALLIAKKAPEINASAAVVNRTIENYTLDALEGKNIILFFYPLDFTFVCPTELLAFEDRKADFEKRDTVVVGCSTDSIFSHLAWLATPRSKGGIEGVSYPIIADFTKEISRAYDVLDEEAGIPFRGLFLIDKKGIVRHQLINDLPLGRSIDEALRMVDALTFYEKHGEVCPANWMEGKKSMKPTKKGLEAYFA
ncbi:Thioredoxin peroxidase 1 [Chlamydiales bacterium SCGC AG-110-M15]|nr:Thioredoxin peroxidase 1 [Chlamydiales bacterium SCGC AG-110-M15]